MKELNGIMMNVGRTIMRHMQLRSNTSRLILAILLAWLLPATSAQAANDTARFNGAWSASFVWAGVNLSFVSIHTGADFRNYQILPQGSAFCGGGQGISRRCDPSAKYALARVPGACDLTWQRHQQSEEEAR